MRGEREGFDEGIVCNRGEILNLQCARAGWQTECDIRETQTRIREFICKILDLN